MIASLLLPLVGFALFKEVMCLRCHNLTTAELPGKVVNGSLVADGHTFQHDDFERIGETDLFRTCICTVRNCVRKCCGPNQVILNKTCTDMGVELTPLPVYTKDLQLIPHHDFSSFHLVYGDTCTNGKYRLEPDEQWYLLETGEILFLNQSLGVESACVEHVGIAESNLSAFICFESDSNEVIVMYPIGMCISIPFLVITFLVYALLPELRGLHAKNLLSHVSALLVAYTALVLVQLASDFISDGFCVTLAFTIQFSFLATFFWLNVMSFDIWWTFSGFGGFRGSVRERETKRFILYSFYAWGASFLILVVSVAMDYAPQVPDTYIKPNFGKKKCFFHDKLASLVYFYGPIGILLFCNVILFIMTAYKIIMVKRETKVLSNRDSRRHDEANKQRLMLYLKLFLVMGVNWVMEVISWAVAGPAWIWYLTDLGNTMQGLLMFLIFVWKPRVRKLILQRLYPGRVTRDAETNTSSLKMSMSRNSSTVGVTMNEVRSDRKISRDSVHV